MKEIRGKRMSREYELLRTLLEKRTSDVRR